LCLAKYTGSCARIRRNAVAKYAFEPSVSCAFGATQLIPGIRSCKLLAASAEETWVSLRFEARLFKSLFPLARVTGRGIIRTTGVTIVTFAAAPV
jgi:hypothetical protein